MMLESHSSGRAIARIVDGFDDGYFWQDRFQEDNWLIMGWYRTLRGAKIAAAHYWGESLVWEEVEEGRNA